MVSRYHEGVLYVLVVFLGDNYWALQIQFSKNQFVYYLYAVALLYKILTHGIDVVEELAECCLHHVWLSLSLVGIGVDYNFNTSAYE